MIPLTLKVMPQEVYPNGFRKTVYVLSLDIPSTMTELLKYAHLTPGEAVLPALDAEPPEDLFPPVVLSHEESPEPPHVQDEAPHPTSQDTEPPDEFLPRLFVCATGSWVSPLGRSSVIFCDCPDVEQNIL